MNDPRRMRFKSEQKDTVSGFFDSHDSRRKRFKSEQEDTVSGSFSVNDSPMNRFKSEPEDTVSGFFDFNESRRKRFESEQDDKLTAAFDLMTHKLTLCDDDSFPTTPQQCIQQFLQLLNGKEAFRRPSAREREDAEILKKFKHLNMKPRVMLKKLPPQFVWAKDCHSLAEGEVRVVKVISKGIEIRPTTCAVAYPAGNAVLKKLYPKIKTE